MREPQKIYSPYVARTATDANFAEGVYWGDTHLHTSYSTDAGMMGNTLGPEEAYRFAMGEEVLSAAGMRVTSDPSRWTFSWCRTTPRTWGSLR